MTGARWKMAALIILLVVVVLVVLLLLGDTLGVNHQGHSLAPMPTSPKVGQAAG